MDTTYPLPLLIAVKIRAAHYCCAFAAGSTEARAKELLYLRSGAQERKPPTLSNGVLIRVRQCGSSCHPSQSIRMAS